MNIFLLSFLIILGIQVFFFLLAATLKTDKFTDLSYGITFVIVALILLLRGSFSFAQLVLFAAIALWGLRLATYLFIRILKIGKDDRFDDIREKVLEFAKFWGFQAISIFIILLPAIYFFSITPIGINSISSLGLGISLFGLLFETVADYQKYVYKNRKTKIPFITTGLWKYSRHPNYFGEMLVWWGMFIYIYPFLSGISYLTIVGPIFITILLLFISGIPPLEKRHKEKYGDMKEYRKYKESTSLLIPLPPER